MTVRIVTDSTCDLPEDVIKKYNISVIPLYINAGSQSYLDGIDISRDEFYENLPNFPTHPTTAVPSMEKFMAIYNMLAEEGAQDVISIHISATLSAVTNVAQIAASHIRSARIIVKDSRQLSLGTGFLVETAARLAQAGHTAYDIVNILDEQIKRTRVFAALDTLEFLRRSGRMNSVMATIGNLIQIKPILFMYDGKTGAERVRTQKNAIIRVIERLRQFAPFEKAAVLHSNALNRAQTLLEQVQQVIPGKEIWLQQINPVIGTHIGPGVVGFAAVQE